MSAQIAPSRSTPQRSSFDVASTSPRRSTSTGILINSRHPNRQSYHAATFSSFTPPSSSRKIRFAPLPDPRRAVVVTEEGHVLPIVEPAPCAFQGVDDTPEKPTDDSANLSGIARSPTPMARAKDESGTGTDAAGDGASIGGSTITNDGGKKRRWTKKLLGPLLSSRAAADESGNNASGGSGLGMWKSSSKELTGGSGLGMWRSSSKESGGGSGLGLWRTTSRDSTSSVASGSFGGDGSITRRMSNASTTSRPSAGELGTGPAKGPQKHVMLNGRVYGVGGGAARNLAQPNPKPARREDPAFVEWGYGGMGSVGSAKATDATAADYSKLGGSTAVGGGSNPDDDDGGGMGWVRRRREAREKAAREAEEKKKAEENVSTDSKTGDLTATTKKEDDTANTSPDGSIIDSGTSSSSDVNTSSSSETSTPTESPGDSPIQSRTVALADDIIPEITILPHTPTTPELHTTKSMSHSHSMTPTQSRQHSIMMSEEPEEIPAESAAKTTSPHHPPPLAIDVPEREGSLPLATQGARPRPTAAATTGDETPMRRSSSHVPTMMSAVEVEQSPGDHGEKDAEHVYQAVKIPAPVRHHSLGHHHHHHHHHHTRSTSYDAKVLSEAISDIGPISVEAPSSPAATSPTSPTSPAKLQGSSSSSSSASASEDEGDEQRSVSDDEDDEEEEDLEEEMTEEEIQRRKTSLGAGVEKVSKHKD